jgi:hypothetical protein
VRVGDLVTYFITDELCTVLGFAELNRGCEMLDGRRVELKYIFHQEDTGDLPIVVVLRGDGEKMLDHREQFIVVQSSKT